MSTRFVYCTCQMVKDLSGSVTTIAWSASCEMHPTRPPDTVGEVSVGEVLTFTAKLLCNETFERLADKKTVTCILPFGHPPVAHAFAKDE